VKNPRIYFTKLERIMMQKTESFPQEIGLIFFLDLKQICINSINHGNTYFYSFQINKFH